MDNTIEEGAGKKRDVLLPASIVIAGVLVAGSVIWAVGKNAGGPSLTAGPNAPAGADVSAMRAVDDTDHVRGSRDAKVVMVEYSDFECPFCKNFHGTMKDVLADYGNDVAWVYRQFPIAGLHAKATQESEASECAAELGGTEAFWRFADRIFEVTPSNDGLDLAILPNIAEYAGVSRNDFASCLASGRHAAKVSASVAEAGALGINGTPYVVFVSRDGMSEDDFAFLDQVNRQSLAVRPTYPVPFTIDEESGRIGMSGAYPKEMVKQIIDTLLGN